MIKKTLKSLLKKAVQPIVRELRSELQLSMQEPALQQLLMAGYKREAAVSGRAPAFSEVELSTYTQNGEDGILLMIFSLAGCQSKRVVELCCGDGVECNAANLVINQDFSALG